MLSAFWTSKSGMLANQNKLDTISNNIANSNTTAYKNTSVNFKDLITEKLDQKGIPLNNKNSVIGTGVKTSNYTINNNQGSLLETSINTDLSIDGNGYFKVIDKNNNEFYTRDGSFQLDSSGKLVNNKGNILEIDFYEPNNIENNTLKSNNFSIDKNGIIHITKDKNTIAIGKIKTYTAVGNDSFISVDNNLKIANPQSEIIESNDNNILQGYLESSNVDIVKEFTDMITVQRSFQLSSKGLQTADEMWGMVNNLKK